MKTAILILLAAGLGFIFGFKTRVKPAPDGNEIILNKAETTIYLYQAIYGAPRYSTNSNNRAVMIYVGMTPAAYSFFKEGTNDLPKFLQKLILIPPN